MDVDKDQKLTKVEILDMLKTFNMDPADMKEVIDELMAKFDTDGDGGVSYNEFAEFVKPKNVVDLTNVADHNNRGVGYFDAEHAAKIKKAAPLKPVKEATAAELEGYRAKLAEKIGTKYKLLTRAFRDIDTDHSGYLSKQEIVDAVYNFNLGASSCYGSTLRATAKPTALFPLSCRLSPPSDSPRAGIPKEHVGQLIDKVADTDHDGKIEYDEFAKLCHALEAEDIGGQAVVPHDASIEAGEFSWDDPMHAGNAHLHLHRHPELL